MSFWRISRLKDTLMLIWEPPYMFVFIHIKNTLKILHYQCYKFSRYLPVKFVTFLKSRLISNIFYCLWMFVIKRSFIKGVLRIIFIWRRSYWQIFKSALVYFYVIFCLKVMSSLGCGLTGKCGEIFTGF